MYLSPLFAFQCVESQPVQAAGTCDVVVGQRLVKGFTWRGFFSELLEMSFSDSLLGQEDSV